MSEVIVCPSNGNNPTAQTAQVICRMTDVQVCPSNGNNLMAHSSGILLCARQKIAQCDTVFVGIDAPSTGNNTTAQTAQLSGFSRVVLCKGTSKQIFCSAEHRRHKNCYLRLTYLEPISSWADLVFFRPVWYNFQIGHCYKGQLRFKSNSWQIETFHT